MATLKVYRTPIGFHDAYVAASSQKAALAAWGSDKNLFARGDAEIVTDPALTAEPLAHPGTVIKRSRGSAAEQIAALPPDKPRAPEKAVSSAKPAPQRPRPDRDAIEAADEKIAATKQRYAAARADLAARIADLEKQRQALQREQDDALAGLAKKRDQAAQDYEKSLLEWRG